MEFEFKKIHAVIPKELYEKLQQKQKFNNEWDSWLTNAIAEALEREDKT